MPRERAIEPVPPELRERVLGLFERREPDVAVADLVSDSLLDGAAGADSTRRLVFRSSDREIDLAVQSDGRTLQVAVQVLPEGSYAVTLRSVESLAVDTTDDGGAAVLTDVGAGLASVLVESTDNGYLPLRTAWVTL